MNILTRIVIKIFQDPDFKNLQNNSVYKILSRVFKDLEQDSPGLWVPLQSLRIQFQRSLQDSFKDIFKKFLILSFRFFY